jgi:hypothetical protein
MAQSHSGLSENHHKPFSRLSSNLRVVARKIPNDEDN